MKQPQVITLKDGKKILINEDQVCSILKTSEGLAEIHMSNGEIYICVHPTHDAWLNDFHIRKI